VHTAECELRFLTADDRGEKFSAEQARESAQHIYHSAEYMLCLVDDIHDTAALDSGSSLFYVEGIQPETLFAELLLLVKVPAENKQVTLRCGQQSAGVRG